ncbi:hypothetical protein [Actinomadura napierensis]|uniref:Uncharacterized protein n=1 Tax=Actinomadura napierensis TaxID=267854 RepID=A0ABN3ADK1_9ACTN
MDFECAPDAVGRDRRPLRRVFEGLAAAGVEVDGVVLLGTLNRQRPGTETFAAYGRQLRELMCSPEGLFGRSFAADRVRVVEVAEPRMRHCRVPTARVMGEIEPRACLVSSGSGSYALGAGALLAALERGVPATLVPVHERGVPYRFEDLVTADRPLRNWLLRHRFWAELAEFDPDDADVWRLLAARQRADVGQARRAKRHGGVPGMNAGQLVKLTELGLAVEAAFFERVARGEAIDQSLLRAWFLQSLAKRLKSESEAMFPATRDVVEELVTGLTSRKGRGAGDRELLRQARERLPRPADGECAAMLRDPQLAEFLEAAASHAAHLSESGTGLLPRTVTEQADRWEGSDLVPKLLKQRGITPWPVLGGGDVLVLMSAGLGRQGESDEQDRQALREVLTWVSDRNDRFPRPGRFRLRLLATERTRERLESLATWVRSLRMDGSVDAEVVGPLPMPVLDEPPDVSGTRDVIWGELEAAGRATGRAGSGSLRDVDEVVLVLNPGPAAVGNAMIAAGLEWSLTAACPLRIVELGRDRGVRPVARDGGRVLRRLGPDVALAALAARAMRRLDVRTAWRLLGHASERLDEVREAVGRLHRDLYADPETGGKQERYRLARQRLALVARVLADDPWPACYVAVEAIRPGLLGWDTRLWKDTVTRSPVLKDLVALRDTSPYAHLLDRLRQGDREPDEPPAKEYVLRLITQVITDLRAGGNRDASEDLMLFTRFERICAELDRHAQERA